MSWKHFSETWLDFVHFCGPNRFARREKFTCNRILWDNYTIYVWLSGQLDVKFIRVGRWRNSRVLNTLKLRLLRLNRIFLWARYALQRRTASIIMI